MKHTHFAHIDLRVYHTHAHEVRLYERAAVGTFGGTHGGNELTLTYAALDWLSQRGWLPMDTPGEPWDWDLNMHGGELGFTSFWFRDASKAIEFKLVWAGVSVK